MDVMVKPSAAPDVASPSRVREVLPTALGVRTTLAVCLLALAPPLRVLFGGSVETLRWAWDAAHGSFCIGLDALSAFFLLPILGLSALAALYGGSYLFPYRERKSLACSWLFFNLFVI